MIYHQLIELYNAFPHGDREPKFFILNPGDEYDLKMYFLQMEPKKETMNLNGVRIIRSYDIEKGSPELV